MPGGALRDVLVASGTRQAQVVPRSPFVDPADIVLIFDNPKSDIHGTSSLLIKIFSGFRSKCNMLRLCSIAIPLHIPHAS